MLCDILRQYADFTLLIKIISPSRGFGKHSDSRAVKEKMAAIVF